MLNNQFIFITLFYHFNYGDTSKEKICACPE
jgi:hypothetical protein